jgi:molybdopterin converting factor small subunit
LIHHDRIQKDEEEFTIQQGTRLNDLRQLVFLRFPELRVSKDEIIVSVNREFLKDRNPILHDNDIIAFLPPVSGG